MSECTDTLDGKHHFEIRKIDQWGGTERRCKCGRLPTSEQALTAEEAERATAVEWKRQKAKSLRFTASNAPKEQGRL